MGTYAGRTRVMALLAVTTLALSTALQMTTQPAAEAATQPTPAPPAGTVGQTAGFAQTSWMMLWGSDADVNRDLDAIQATGAKWLRVDFDWASAEPTPGTYRWSYIDRVVERATARGLHILATPAYTPGWARPAGTSDKYAPTEPSAYTAFVTAAARRYAPLGVHHWEIWNEPNVVQFWEPRPNPVQYATMLRSSAAALRSVDRAAVVVTAGLAPAADSADGRYVSPRTFLSSLYANGARDSFDAVGMHPYAWPYGVRAPGDWNQWYSLPKTYSLMQANGDGAKKIWATEYGAPTGSNSRAVSEQDQARFVQEAFDEWNIEPWAGPIFWYSLRDQGTDREDLEQNFGVMRLDFAAKPALQEFKQEMAEQATTGPPVATPRPSLACVWRPWNGTWYMSSWSAGPGDGTSLKWGLAGDVPVGGSDMDGDGKSEMVVWRPSNETWYVFTSSSGFTQSIVRKWGLIGDVPVGGTDVDGDAKTDMVVWRPWNGTWYVLTSSSGFTGSMVLKWGLAGDVPVGASDMDGDGKSDMVVWRPRTETWYVFTSSSGFTQSIVRKWGLAGDVPVGASDMDGDAKSDMVVWRPWNGTWYVLTSSSGFTQSIVRKWGLAGDVPVGGTDADGDAKSDMVVWRPWNGTWYVFTSSSGYTASIVHKWGLAGDVPVGGTAA